MLKTMDWSMNEWMNIRLQSRKEISRLLGIDLGFEILDKGRALRDRQDTTNLNNNE